MLNYRGVYNGPTAHWRHLKCKWFLLELEQQGK